jgi:UDP-N-acetylmuramyl pentapeptide phosphotransferase/UDP-N-acetylglucosamine-1-phosphate transferase
MHRVATPRGGGAAIVAVSLIGIVLGGIFGLRPEPAAVGGYLAGALLIVGVSLMDDVLGLPSGTRLAVHLLAAAAAVAGLVLGSQLIGGSQTGITLLLLAAALFWTVGLTNAYNFMDGIDGLAATQAIVAGFGWTLLGSVAHQPWLTLLGLLIAAGSTGFLIHNWAPAKIFMGDVGSAFLGFTFAFMAIAALRRTPQVALVGALLLWPFIFDSVFTMLRRLWRGENIFLAHRSHLYQRLVLAGWRHASVTSLYGLFALVTSAISVVWLVTATISTFYCVIVVVSVLSVGLWMVVIRAERKVIRPAA